MSIDFPATHFITFLRHGKSQANEDNVLQGQMDSPLSTEGIRQSQALAEYWSAEGVNFNKIISSPLERAHQTARIISELLFSPIELVDHWKERAFGEAEGLFYDDILSKYKELPPRSIYEPAYGTGESDWDLYIRAAKAVQNVTYQPVGRFLVVSHGAILNAALSVIIGMTPRPPTHRVRFRFRNTGYANLEYNTKNQNWTIHSLNNDFHLFNMEKNRNLPSN
jgi:2,3-bisphosphoglycerate-dependent phosphoglycerate mutase